MPFHSVSHQNEVDKRSDAQALEFLSTDDFIKYEVPNRPDENGQYRTWEPEFGPTLIGLKGICGAQSKLRSIPNFKILKGLTRDFSYVSATLNAPTGYVGRARWNYYKEPTRNKGDLSRTFTARTMSGGKTGFKSDRKSAFREECEAPLDATIDLNASFKQLRLLHKTTLPLAIRRLKANDAYMTGLMCVERAGFESTHLLKDGNAQFLINYAGSYDGGTCHDIRLSGVPSIIANHFETELEVTSVRSPYKLSNTDLIEIIEASMEEIQPQVTALFADVSIPEDDPRYTMGKNTRAAYEQSQHATAAEIRTLRMQPADLMTKSGVASLHEIFDGKDSPLISPEQIHFLAQMDNAQMEMANNKGVA